MAKRHMIPLFVPHAGCPHACVFCNQRKITGADTPVTPSMVAEEIGRSLAYAGTGCELAFYGGSFTAIEPEKQEQLLEAVQPYVESGAVATIRCSTRPDAISPEVLTRLKKYHVDTVELGCQSMDDRVLALSERGHTAEDTRRAAVLLRENGFSLVLQMMTGLPGDDGSASIHTADELIALRPDGVRIYPTVVLQDTKLLQLMHSGAYRPHRVEDAVPLCAEIYEKFLAAGIPVIRLGLNPTELLSGGEAVDGAYHPALGELVLSEMFLHRAERAIAGMAGETEPSAACSDCPKNGPHVYASDAEPASAEESRSASEPVHGTAYRMTAQHDHTVCELRGATARLLVHPSRISVMVGQKRRNLKLLQEKYGFRQLKAAAAPLGLWEVRAEINAAK